MTLSRPRREEMTEAKSARNAAAERYRPQAIEMKWQQKWLADGLYDTDLNAEQRFYLLTMLPYTSGHLHVGHWYPNAPSGAFARYHRTPRYDAFAPTGFDAL